MRDDCEIKIPARNSRVNPSRAPCEGPIHVIPKSEIRHDCGMAAGRQLPSTKEQDTPGQKTI